MSCFESFEHLRFDAVADPRPINGAADEARLFEHLQVLGDGRLGQRQVFDDVAAHARVPRKEERTICTLAGWPRALASEASSAPSPGPSPWVGETFRASVSVQHSRSTRTSLRFIVILRYTI